ncbi:MAG: DEAD/DEAH box helicase, partial [Deltaproteobacteria bacterium]|nr:DEAD/DEAH box helicase [Deltaproteobacteria bacterium]
GSLVDQTTAGKPIRFVEGVAKLVVVIEDQDEVLTGRVTLHHQGEEFSDITMLTRNHAFSQGLVFRIQPVREQPTTLKLFETTFSLAQIEKYLSLLFSLFHNISVRYKDYRVVAGAPKHTQPTLIFEKIDSNNALYLRVTNSLPGFDSDFFEQYDINRISLLNDLDKNIIVSEIIPGELYASFDELEKLLKKYRKSTNHGSNYFIEDNLFIIDEQLAKQFVYGELPNLISRYVILGAQRLKPYKLKTVSPSLQLSLSHGLDFLEGDVNLEIEGQTFSLFEVLTQYKKNSYVQLNDGVHAIINPGYLDKLQRLFKKQKEKVRVSFFDLPIVEELIDEKIAAEFFPKSREIFLGFNNIKNFIFEFPVLNAHLREYQKQGYQWIKYLQQHGLGGCLADDMGLGKTIQTIALLASIYPEEKKCTIIIMPKSLLFNWEVEINKFKPELTYYVYHGANRDLTEAKSKHLILTTYAMVRNHIKEFQEEEFCYIILDESQNIKNLNSQAAKAVMLLKSKHRLALSGTPLENHLGELYSLFRFLNPAMFGSAEDFNRYYAGPIQRDNDKDVMRELRKKIYPFILRRLKRDVLQDLPDKIEQTLFVEMTREQKVFYEQRRSFYYQTVKSQIAQNGVQKSQFFILQALNELRQIASIPEAKSDRHIISPKREIIMENLLDILANNHKVLIFVNYLQAIDCLSEDFEKAGIDYLIMTGATRDRKEVVQKFQDDDTVKVFLMTLRTGGLGLNLTAADYIFIFDPWWNKAAENQAIDRSHRIGQDKTVFSYKLVTKHTIEEKIIELQKIKTNLFESLISSDDSAIKSFDEKDVEFMLGA